MALYPGARKELIPAGSNDPAITPIGVILHVDAGNVGDLHNYFNGPSGGIESHFHVPKVGAPYQYRDTSREADANYHGNSFKKNGKTYGFISVETQGLAAGEWTDHQLAEIKKLLLWANKTHGIPLRRCPAWNEAGIGWHVMWGAPGPWTPHAKVCPGPDRVKQFNNVLVPWFAHATTPDTVEDELSAAEVKDLKNFIEARTQAYAAFGAKHTDQVIKTALELIEAVVQKYAAFGAKHTDQVVAGADDEAEILTKIDGLKKQLQTLAAAPVDVTPPVEGTDG